MTRFAVLFALLLTCSGAARSQDGPVEAARTAMDQLDQAALALNHARGAGDRIAALTTTIAAYERGLAALRDGLRLAAAREGAVRAQIGAESQRLQQLLGVLLVTRSAPEATLLLHPAGPLDAARAGMIVAELAPGMQDDLASLGDQLAEIETLRAVQERATATLSEGLEQVRAARTELGRAVDERDELPQRFVDDPEALASLARGADTLSGFAETLGQSGSALGNRPRPRAFAAARGDVALPVDGVLLRTAGEADAAGVARPGIVLATRPRALVTTPWQATIRYQGPLLDYGNVMVLEPARGFLMVLAGLDIVYGATGDILPKGAPVGLMGGTDAGAGEQAASPAGDGDNDRTETLYLELRQGDAPVDPTTWFALSTE